MQHDPLLIYLRAISLFVGAERANNAPAMLMPPPATKERKTADTGAGAIAIATDADTSPARTASALGNGGGEQTASTVPSPPTLASLAEIDHDLLRQILGWAQPPDHHLRFEWSGSVGRTCRKFHELSREDSECNRVSLDIRNSTFGCLYKSMFSTKKKSPRRDLRLALLKRLVEDESMRARVKELHIQNDETHYQELVLPAERDFLPQDHMWPFGGSPTMTYLEHSKAIFDSLTVLLSRPNSFPNLRILDIHHENDTGVTESELFTSELLLALPEALPRLDHLCLSNCFFTSCYRCVNSPSGHRPCATTDVSIDQMVEFATSLKAPLRSLSLGGVPWMSDGHVHALLSVVGKDLQTLELVNCGLRHYSPDPRDLHSEHNFFERCEHANTPISTRSLQVIAKFCGHLRVLRVLREDYTPEEAYEWDAALEAVLRANPRLHANDGIRYHYLTSSSLRYAIQIWHGAFEPTEGSKYAELSPFAARLSSSIVSCRHDPARVTRVLDTAVEVADRVYRCRIPVPARMFDASIAERDARIFEYRRAAREAAHAAALDAALVDSDVVRGEASS